MTTLTITEDLIHMQHRLYGRRARQRVHVDNSDLWRMLHRLRSSPELRSFRLWLVGSRVDTGHDASDIDLVLSPRADTVLEDSIIDRGLRWCREAGLDFDPRCVVDTSFREEGPSLHGLPLRPDAALRTIKLFSPRLMRLIQAGDIVDYRRVGRSSLAYTRLAGDTDFFAKLPLKIVDHSAHRYLRPAIEVVDSLAGGGYPQQRERMLTLPCTSLSIRGRK